MPSGASAADVAVDISASSIRSLDDFAWATFIDDVECHAVQTTFANRTSLWFADLWDSAWLNVGNYWTFRSESGGWAYPLIRTFDLHALSVFVEAAAVAVLMVWLTDGPLRLPIWLSIVVWLSGSWIVQRTIGQLAPDRLGSLIESDTANAFYTPTLRYSWREFLDQHLTLPLARHARTNMPGKVMFFYPLQSLTGSTQAMAYIVMLLSNIGGGLLTFAIAKKLFKDNRAALYSMAFYLLIPGKICFFPLLNTLTPVFVLLSLYLWLLYLESRRSWYLAGLGASFYWLLLFDPIPFCLGFVFVAFLIAAWRQQRFTMTDLLILTGVVGGAFLAVHFVALFAIRYNIFSGLFGSGAREQRVQRGATLRHLAVWQLVGVSDERRHRAVGDRSLPGGTGPEKAGEGAQCGRTNRHREPAGSCALAILSGKRDRSRSRRAESRRSDADVDVLDRFHGDACGVRVRAEAAESRHLPDRDRYGLSGNRDDLHRWHRPALTRERCLTSIGHFNNPLGMPRLNADRQPRAS